MNPPSETPVTFDMFKSTTRLPATSSASALKQSKHIAANARAFSIVDLFVIAISFSVLRTKTVPFSDFHNYTLNMFAKASTSLHVTMM